MNENEMETEELTEEERRTLRRERRIASQRKAMLGLVLSILILAAVLVVSILWATQTLKDSRQNGADEEVQMQEIFSEMASEEAEVSEEELESVVEYTPEEVLDEVVEAVISEMTLEEKVAGLFLVTPEAITGVDTAIQAGEGTKTALEKYPVGGLIYFTKNIRSEEQIKDMIGKSVTYHKFPVFIAVDEEGGKVSRVAEALGTEKVGAMAEIGSTGENSKAYEAMQKVGNYLTSYGFNLNMAPVADVLTNENNTSIGDRAFGEDPTLVAGMVTSAMHGLEDAGVTACVKHFPGIGAAGEDTHNGLVVIDKSLEELKQTELVPFVAAIEAGADMIMAGHISLPQITGDNMPATMSEAILSDLLRSQLGFNGVIITDAMNMGAITEYYGADEAAIKALKAGADMILMPEDFELAYTGVIEAVQNGTISEDRINDSLKRVYRIKYADSVGE